MIAHKELYQNSGGQVIVEYLLLVAVILGMISLMALTFKKTRKELATVLRTNMEKVISDGSIVHSHPLLEGRVKEVE